MITEIVTFGDSVKRLISRPWDDEYFGAAMRAIVDDRKAFVPRFAEALAGIHKRLEEVDYLRELLSELLDNTDKYLGPQRVHWYWSEFYRTLRDAHEAGAYSKFIIRIKACYEHYLYTLEGLEKGSEAGDTQGWVLVHEPFFKKSPPPRLGDRKKEEDIRGLADTIYFLSPALLSNLSAESMHRFLSWFDLKLFCTVEGVRNNDSELQLRIQPEIQETKCISFPPDYEQVLMSSPNVRDAMAALAEVWLHREARSVVLSAAPGSGKEVFKKVLATALRLPKENIIEASAAAIGTYSALEVEILQGRLPTKHEQEPIKKDEGRQMLFLDEIHHDAAEDLRAGLLRLMESEELVARDGTILRCDNILYVLAASLSPTEIRALRPPDLWTRIEHTVTIRHPLRLRATDGSRQEILHDYFDLFWRGCTVSRIFPEPEGDLPPVPPIEEEGLVSGLAREFAQQLASPLIPLVSVRVLRNMVKRLRSRTQFFIRTNPNLRGAGLLKSYLPEFRDSIFEMFDELAPENHVRAIF